MRKNNSLIILCLVYTLLISGCVPLIIGGAVGALGGYAISKDTIQADTDMDYEQLWKGAVNIVRSRGTPKIEDYARGYLTAEIEAGKVWIRLIRLNKITTRLRVSARKYGFPYLGLAQDLFVKIMEGARE